MTPREELDEEIRDLLDGAKRAYTDTKIWGILYLVGGMIGSLIYAVIKVVGDNASFFSTFAFTFGKILSVLWFFVSITLASVIYFFIKFHLKFKFYGRVRLYSDTNELTIIDTTFFFLILVLIWSPMICFY